MNTKEIAEQLSFEGEKNGEKKTIPPRDWESEATLNTLADEVEAQFPTSDDQRKFAITKVLLAESVPPHLAERMQRKIGDRLNDRKKEFYASVGGKEPFERGAKRNAFQNRDHEVPE